MPRPYSSNTDTTQPPDHDEAHDPQTDPGEQAPGRLDPRNGGPVQGDTSEEE
ncbi:hypothetical protein [Luteimonas deserti]|uniref:Uncharacterized protein n=1 Tax=Luteimonas deserti TaxID=2752306 RepID=A0A7Z0QRA5_9GAMM|nr:hypothetical protein [Luteimonas deserti]NYZ61585.1 hypothetical protein [Luteimonas deserti]